MVNSGKRSQEGGGPYVIHHEQEHSGFAGALEKNRQLIAEGEQVMAENQAEIARLKAQGFKGRVTLIFREIKESWPFPL